MAAVFMLGLFWSEYLFFVKEIPERTPILLGAILIFALIVNFAFQPETWCRYLCAMGFFSGVCACLASTELRAKSNICTAQCKSFPCFRGDGTRKGCPMKLFPIALMSNQFCKMCGTCVHNCLYNSIHLNLRWPGVELWDNKEPNLVTSLSVPALIGILYPLFLSDTLRFYNYTNLFFTAFYVSSAGGAIALFMAASLVIGRSHFRKQVKAYGYTYLPLAFAGHLALLLPYLLGGLKWIMSYTYTFQHQINTPLPQQFIVFAGIIWSWWTLMKICRKSPFIVAVGHGALILAFGLGLMLVTGY